MNKIPFSFLRSRLTRKDLHPDPKNRRKNSGPQNDKYRYSMKEIFRFTVFFNSIPSTGNIQLLVIKTWVGLNLDSVKKPESLTGYKKNSNHGNGNKNIPLMTDALEQTIRKENRQ